MESHLHQFKTRLSDIRLYLSEKNEKQDETTRYFTSLNLDIKKLKKNMDQKRLSKREFSKSRQTIHDLQDAITQIKYLLDPI